MIAYVDGDSQLAMMEMCGLVRLEAEAEGQVGVISGGLCVARGCKNSLETSSHLGCAKVGRFAEAKRGQAVNGPTVQMVDTTGCQT